MNARKRGARAIVLLLCACMYTGQAFSASDSATSLIEAAARGDVRVFNMMLKMGANPSARGHGGNTAIQMAAYYGQRNMVRRLIDLHVDLNGRGTLGYSAIGAAAMRGDPEIVRMLVKAGADLDVRDGAGGTPLLNAIRFRRDENLKILLQGGANVDFSGNDIAWDETVRGVTPLMLAAKIGRLDYVNELLASGARLGLVDKQHGTALYYAILGLHDAVAQRLIEAGAPLDGYNNGYTIMHWASAMGRKKIIALIKKKRGDGD